jgi:hypothetical protein
VPHLHLLSFAFFHDDIRWGHMSFSSLSPGVGGRNGAFMTSFFYLLDLCLILSLLWIVK